MKNKFYGAMSILLALLFVVSSCCTNNQKRAKYVFYFIGDGMGFSHVALAEAYKAAKDNKIGSEPLAFTQFPAMGMATTYSASNMITCSSAAGTALSTGFKTSNHMLGVDPDTNEVYSIAKFIHENGYKVGVMSTVTIDHATPASFYAHAAYRNDYYAIAAQLPQSGYEFFGGGGFGGVEKQGDKKPLYEIVEENGYTVAFGADEFNAKKSSAEKILFFQDSAKANNILPYSFERTAEDLSLAQVVKAAIEFLDNDKGFFIMAEGGQIDWAAHANDVVNTIHETIDFDEAIQVAYEFYKQHPDETLIVVTADHETGGVTLGRTKGYTFDLSSVPDRLAHKSTEERAGINNYMEHTPADSLSKAAKIGWTTTSHTGGAVPVFAVGAGSRNFVGRMDNTDIPKKIMNAMGMEFPKYEPGK